MTISVWENDFPKGYGHTTIAYLKRCNGYKEAKNGNMDAAKSIVYQCVKWKRINELRRRYPTAVLLPVVSSNMIPLALASTIGLPIYLGVHMLHTHHRKNMTAIGRLAHKPVFYGSVPVGMDFILVDDIVTQGGTMAALRRYILSQGGRVLAVTALAYSVGSTILAPRQENIMKMNDKFGNELTRFLKAARIADDPYELTNSQLFYLLRFNSFENILVKLALYIESANNRENLTMYTEQWEQEVGRI